MSEPRAWLPEHLIAERRPAERLRDLVRGWAEDWFVDARPSVGDWTRADAGAVFGPVVLCGDGPALQLRAEAELAAAALMFGTPGEGAPTAADRARLEQAGEACLHDLRRLVADLFDASAAWRPTERFAPDGPVHLCAVGAEARETGEPLFRLIVPEELLVRRIRAELPAPVRRAALPRLDMGLARQTVSLSALLGRCRLSLGELAGCGAGDVLVLDRALDDPLDLAVDRRARDGAPCRVVEVDDRLHLILS